MKAAQSETKVMMSELQDYFKPLAKIVFLLCIDMFIMGVLFSRTIDGNLEVAAPADFMAGFAYFVFITLPHMTTFIKRLHAH